MMKNKNRVLKTCLTALALSVAGLANATNDSVMSDDDMLTYSVISGGAVNIAAQPAHSTTPNVGGHIAGQAAVAVGAFTTVNDIYAGAAVTTGAWSKVEQIYAGAAAGVGANAFALDVDAGAAVVVGANGQVGTITAGAAITLGAGVGHQVAEDYAGVVTRGAGSTFDGYSDIYNGWATAAGTSTGKIKKADDMAVAMENIDEVLERTANEDQEYVITNTDLSNYTIGVTDGESTFYYSAINLQANTELEIRGNVTVITSEAMTMGAGAEIVLHDGATVTWILGGSLNLGAGSKFSGETYVNGAVNGATSDVGCGNLYATGPISMRTIGASCTLPYNGCPAWSDAQLKALPDTVTYGQWGGGLGTVYGFRSKDYYDNEAWYNGYGTYAYTLDGGGDRDKTQFTSHADMTYSERQACKSTLIDEAHRRGLIWSSNPVL
jgi:hypothetical protein